MNLLLAIFLSTGNNTDECVWYFLNLFVDVTIGVFICYFFMWTFDGFAKQFEWKVNIHLINNSHFQQEKL